MSEPAEPQNGQPNGAGTPAPGEAHTADGTSEGSATSPAHEDNKLAAKPNITERAQVPDDKCWLIKNQSAQGIEINSYDKTEVLRLAPLEDRFIAKDVLSKLDVDKWVQLNIVNCQAPKAPEEVTTTRIEEIIKGFVGGTFGWVFVGFILNTKPEMNRLLFRGITPFRLYWFGIPIAALIIAAVFLWKSSKKKDILLRLFAHLIGLVLIFLIAVGLPFFGIYKFGGGQELFYTDAPLLQLGRWLQLLFITVASLLPALLYYLFDRQQLATLQERFWRDILRLDPYVKTLSDVKAKYGKQISELYGTDHATSAGRLLADTRWPISVATLVITLGWFMTFLPARSAIELTQPADLYKMLTPQNTAIAFGFLGAYLYGLTLVLRRYVLGDLRPKTYTNITVRILTVIILAWLLNALAPDYRGVHTTVLGFAFFAGIVPETVLTFLQEKIPSLGVFLRGTDFKEKQPLTKLEGIDLYDRARLMDEGVTNIENLAHHDIVDLMLQTRIPTQRIVDWVDQAILYLHLGEDGADACIEKLRGYGIRTVTCLQKACQDERNKAHLSRLFQTLDCGGRSQRQREEDDDDDAKEETGETPDVRVEVPTPDRLPIILTTLEDAEWLEYIKYWRAYRLRDRQTVRDPEQIFAVESPAPDQKESQTQLKENQKQSVKQNLPAPIS